MDERLGGCIRTDVQHTKDKIKIEIINNKRWLRVRGDDIELVSYGIISRILRILLLLFCMCNIKTMKQIYLFDINVWKWILEISAQLKKGEEKETQCQLSSNGVCCMYPPYKGKSVAKNKNTNTSHNNAATLENWFDLSKSYLIFSFIFYAIFFNFN